MRRHRAIRAGGGGSGTGPAYEFTISIVNAVLEAMKESLWSGSSIEIRGFGSFRLRDRAARIGRNPRTGARTRVPAKRICYFKPGKAVIEIVNS